MTAPLAPSQSALLTSRSALVLTFVSSMIFVTSVYWLLFNSVLEMTALPNSLSLANELKGVTNPEVYRNACQILVEGIESMEQRGLAVMSLIKVAICFFIVCSGLMFLLSLRLVRLSLVSSLDSATPVVGIFGRVCDFVGDALRGKVPLWKAFWLLHVLTPLVLGVSFFYLASLVAKPNGLEDLLYLSLAIALIVVLDIFGLVAVWRCAANSSRRAFGWMARAVVLCEATYLVLRTILYLWAVLPVLLPLKRALG